MVAEGVDFTPWLGRGLDEDRCFVCSLALTAENRTKEDVFPKWLQRQFPSWRDRALLLLPNLTGLALRSYLIPCCKRCNNDHLGALERKIKEAFERGPAAVESLGEAALRTWAAKIAYGCRRNDLRLLSDRSDRNSSTIASRVDLANLADLHDLIQECRGVVAVADGHSSLSIFQAQSSGCELCDFDAIIPVGWPSPFVLRLNEIVVVGAIDDRGLLKGMTASSLFKILRKTPLHPIQVRALAAVVIARCARLNPKAVPLRYGVSDKLLHIDRAEPPAGVPRIIDRGTPSADVILGSLLGETESSISSFGGALGLLRAREGYPVFLKLRHGEERLADVRRTALLPDCADLF